MPHFFNPNLHKLKIKEFFKRARLEQFNFDIAKKEGLCIMLLDQLTSGVMSLMSVSVEELESIQLMKKVIEFMVKLSAVKNVEYGHTDCEPATDRINIKDVLSLFISLLRKDERKNAKQKAIREHAMNGSLEFIC